MTATVTALIAVTVLAAVAGIAQTVLTRRRKREADKALSWTVFTEPHVWQRRPSHLVDVNVRPMDKEG